MNLEYQYSSIHPKLSYRTVGGGGFLFNYATQSLSNANRHMSMAIGAETYHNVINSLDIVTNALYTFPGYGYTPSVNVNSSGNTFLDVTRTVNMVSLLNNIDTEYGVEYNVCSYTKPTIYTRFNCDGSLYEVKLTTETGLNILKDNVALNIPSASNYTYFRSNVEYCKIYLHDNYINFKVGYDTNPGMIYETSSSVSTGSKIDNFKIQGGSYVTSFNIYSYDESDVLYSHEGGNVLWRFKPALFEIPIAVKSDFVAYAPEETSTWLDTSSSIYDKVTEDNLNLGYNKSGSLVTVGSQEFGFKLNNSFVNISNRNPELPRGYIDKVWGMKMYVMDEFNFDNEKSELQFKATINGDVYIQNKNYFDNRRMTVARFIFDTPYSAEIDDAIITVKDIS